VSFKSSEGRWVKARQSRELQNIWIHLWNRKC